MVDGDKRCLRYNTNANNILCPTYMISCMSHEKLVSGVTSNGLHWQYQPINRLRRALYTILSV